MKISELYRIDEEPNTPPSWRDKKKEVGNLKESAKKRSVSFCKRYRHKLKLDRKQMAKISGISASHYRNLELGIYPMSERVLSAFTNNLELTKEEREELFDIWVQASGVRL